MMIVNVETWETARLSRSGARSSRLPPSVFTLANAGQDSSRQLSAFVDSWLIQICAQDFAQAEGGGFWMQ